MLEFGGRRLSRVVCLAVAALIAGPQVYATTIIVSQQDDRTLSGTVNYQLTINNGRNITGSSGFGSTIAFNSSSYSFALTGYNPALMTMISATMDLQRLASSTLDLLWAVNPDPGDPWRPHAYSPSSSYTFVTVSAPTGSNASASFGVGPDSPVSNFNLLPLFASDINANIPLVFAWQQSLTIGACYDGSCGGAAYNRNWPGAPGGRLYNLILTGQLHTYIEADVTFSDTVAEPATFALIGGGLLALGLFRRRFSVPHAGTTPADSLR